MNGGGPPPSGVRSIGRGSDLRTPGACPMWADPGEGGVEGEPPGPCPVVNPGKPVDIRRKSPRPIQAVGFVPASLGTVNGSCRTTFFLGPSEIQLVREGTRRRWQGTPFRHRCWREVFPARITSQTGSWGCPQVGRPRFHRTLRPFRSSRIWQSHLAGHATGDSQRSAAPCARTPRHDQPHEIQAKLWRSGSVEGVPRRGDDGCPRGGRAARRCGFR